LTSFPHQVEIKNIEINEDYLMDRSNDSNEFPNSRSES